MTPERKKEIREKALELRGSLTALNSTFKGSHPTTDQLLLVLENLVNLLLETTE